jgi:sulfate adenylyltransferase
MISPHGGKLVDRVLDEECRKDVLAEAQALPKLRINDESVSDVENIATGVYSPLEGFIGKADYRNVLNEMRLRSDLPWTIPIVLDASPEEAAKLKDGKDVLLVSESGRPVAVLHLEEKFEYNKDELAEKVFLTMDRAHPGVAKVAGMKDILLAGPLDLLEVSPTPFDRYKLNPKETRILFKEKGWKTIVAFQTRNTHHIGHEDVQKTALTSRTAFSSTRSSAGRKRAISRMRSSWRPTMS